MRTRAASRPIPTDTTEELALLERLLAGDDSAWREFRILYDGLIMSRISKVVRAFPNLVSRADIEDIHGEFLLALSSNGLHKLRSFEPARGVRLTTWIGLLATHATWDYMRRLGRRAAHRADRNVQELPDHVPDALAGLVARERCGVAAEAVNQLSGRDRAFMKLLFIDEVAPENVARELGVSIKTVYSMRHKIQAKLAARVRRYRAG